MYSDLTVTDTDEISVLPRVSWWLRYRDYKLQTTRHFSSEQNKLALRRGGEVGLGCVGVGVVPAPDEF